MSLVAKRLRQALIFLLGAAVLIIGVIMIPMPGPGLLIMLLGFMILSTEFAWARKHNDRLKAHFHASIKKFRQAVAEAKANDPR